MHSHGECRIMQPVNDAMHEHKTCHFQHQVLRLKLKLVILLQSHEIHSNVFFLPPNFFFFPLTFLPLIFSSFPHIYSWYFYLYFVTRKHAIHLILGRMLLRYNCYYQVWQLSFILKVLVTIFHVIFSYLEKGNTYLFMLKVIIILCYLRLHDLIFSWYLKISN